MKQGIVTKAEQEFKIVEKLRDILSQLNIGFWKAGGILYDVRERKGYKALGHNSFEDYCEGELGRSGSAINQLLRAYEVAVLNLNYKVEELPEPSKVYIIAEIIEADPDNADEWMAKANTLTADDLRKEKRAYKFGTSKCEHPKTEIMVLEVCVDGCKDRWRRYDLEEKLKKVVPVAFRAKSKKAEVKKTALATT